MSFVVFISFTVTGMQSFDLESFSYSVAVIVQIYLSINRPDMAKKEYERAKRWAEDDLLLQLIESTIDLVTGKNGYNNPLNFYTEQLGNPSLTSPHILTSRGVARILRNEIPEARSDLEEALQQQGDDAETLAAFVVASGLVSTKKGEAGEAEELWAYVHHFSPSSFFLDTQGRFQATTKGASDTSTRY